MKQYITNILKGIRTLLVEMNQPRVTITYKGIRKEDIEDFNKFQKEFDEIQKHMDNIFKNTWGK